MRRRINANAAANGLALIDDMVIEIVFKQMHHNFHFS